MRKRTALIVSVMLMSGITAASAATMADAKRAILSHANAKAVAAAISATMVEAKRAILSYGDAKAVRAASAATVADKPSILSHAVAKLDDAIATPGDALNLSSMQQRTAWHDLTTPPLNQAPPPGFNVKVGAVVPNAVTTAPIPPKAASDVPALQPYRFAILQHKLVIVNPVDKKIAEVISE